VDVINGWPLPVKSLSIKVLEELSILNRDRKLMITLGSCIKYL